VWIVPPTQRLRVFGADDVARLSQIANGNEVIGIKEIAMVEKVIAGLRFRDELHDRFNSRGRPEPVRLFYIESQLVDEQTFHDFWLEACAQEQAAKQPHAKSLSK
jgi:hypothetical protein